MAEGEKVCNFKGLAGLPELANEKHRMPVRLEFQIDNTYIFSTSMAQLIFGTC